ncbi:MAG: ornithine cyclodeaminase family protein [Staphylococcus hyicus]|uniref:ornithine cyclodeaminase family protein n=1 Tax=Staphylococcus hyicus TaxID=1284 RepID=UPI002A81E382|nr:ornithine cyclodeaminase family protein [Staphylococcus hyicus]MDY3698526.1 ornithine cyclodeaminase family protein [Staphylococcus hyicus]
MKIWNESDVKSAYQMKDAIRDIEDLFKDIEHVTQTQRLVIPTGEGAQSMLYMPSIHKGKQLGMIKITSITPNNPQHGRPTTQANIILTDINTGEHLASIDGSYLTRLRTGALSGIASKYMSNKESETLGLIGTGGMAYEQLLGNLEVRPIKKVLLYNRTTEKANLFKARIEAIFPHLDVEVVKDVTTLARHSDIINCQTQSTTPVFQAQDIQPGTHINGIGSYRPEMIEMDYQLFPYANHIVFDDIEGVKEEAGEFIEANKRHIFQFNDIDGDLKSIVLNQNMLRQATEDITIFKCVGAAHFDLAVAIGAYQQLNNL